MVFNFFGQNIKLRAQSLELSFVEFFNWTLFNYFPNLFLRWMFRNWVQRDHSRRATFFEIFIFCFNQLEDTLNSKFSFFFGRYPELTCLLQGSASSGDRPVRIGPRFSKILLVLVRSKSSNFFSVLVRSQVLKFFFFLVRSGSVILVRVYEAGVVNRYEYKHIIGQQPGPTGSGPWIPGLLNRAWVQGAQVYKVRPVERTGGI